MRVSPFSSKQLFTGQAAIPDIADNLPLAGLLSTKPPRRTKKRGRERAK